MVELLVALTIGLLLLTLLAVILANKQDLPGALEHLRTAIKYMPPGPNADLVKKQIAQLESATASQPQSK